MNFGDLLTDSESESEFGLSIGGSSNAASLLEIESDDEISLGSQIGGAALSSEPMMVEQIDEAVGFSNSESIMDLKKAAINEVIYGLHSINPKNNISFLDLNDILIEIKTHINALDNSNESNFVRLFEHYHELVKGKDGTFTSSDRVKFLIVILPFIDTIITRQVAIPIPNANKFSMFFLI